MADEQIEMPEEIVFQLVNGYYNVFVARDAMHEIEPESLFYQLELLDEAIEAAAAFAGVDEDDEAFLEACEQFIPEGYLNYRTMALEETLPEDALEDDLFAEQAFGAYDEAIAQLATVMAPFLEAYGE